MKSRWSFQVATLAGIPVRIHATFLFLVAWVAIVHYQHDPHLRSVGLGVAFLFSVFGLVVLHELSHSLVARAFGIGTRDITLWPIGGVSSLQRMPKDPVQELLIAVAGSALNVVLALLLAVGLALTSGAQALLSFDYGAGWIGFLGALMWVNVTLALFNLLPAFPMDGGRALRALLSLFLDRLQATRLAAAVGQILAVLLGVIGLFTNPFLLLIAVFVWLGAGAEALHEEMTAALDGHDVARAMAPDPHPLGPDDKLAVAVQLLLDTGQRVFPVMEAGQVAGVLSDADLMRGLARGGRRGRVGDFMTLDPPVMRSDQPLLGAFRLLRERQAGCVVVVEEGRLIGIVTSRGISDFLAVASALREEQPPDREIELAAPAHQRATSSWEGRA